MSKRKNATTNATTNATNDVRVIATMRVDQMNDVQRQTLIDALIAKLRDSNANANRSLSKKIRRKLRELNHRGGLNERKSIANIFDETNESND